MLFISIDSHFIEYMKLQRRDPVSVFGERERLTLDTETLCVCVFVKITSN